MVIINMLVILFLLTMYILYKNTFNAILKVTFYPEIFS